MSGDPIRLAIVGLGKIARDQHLPAIAGDPAFELVAVATHGDGMDGLPRFGSVEDLLASGIDVDAVVLCTPPHGRRAQADSALQAGKHVLLEKPPGATVAEIATLVETAEQRGCTLFASWHSRFAPAVEPARAFLAERTLLAVTVNWKEDVRVWHPGQTWIWEPGGLGVFDPGINALSIVTRILPRPMFLTSALLSYPSNQAAPIMAWIEFADAGGLRITADFDFLQTGPQSHDIHIDTDAGRLSLSGGGRRLAHDGRTLVDQPKAEYPALYRRFAALIASRTSDVDLSPFVHVADAFLLGRRATVAAFEDASP